MLKDYLKLILTDAFGVVSAVFFCLSFLSTSIFTGSSLDSSSSSSSSPLSSSSENSNKRNLGWILVSVITFYMYTYIVKPIKETTNYTQCICTYIAHLNQYMINYKQYVIQTSAAYYPQITIYCMFSKHAKQVSNTKFKQN